MINKVAHASMTGLYLTCLRHDTPNQPLRPGRLMPTTPVKRPIDDESRAQMQSAHKRALRVMWVVSTISLGGSLLFAVTEWLDPMNNTTGQVIGGAALTALMLFMTGFAWYATRERARQIAEDLRADHFFEVQGPIEDKRDARSAPRRVRVCGQWLSLPFVDYLTLSIGDQVRIRYTPGARQVISVERL